MTNWWRGDVASVETSTRAAIVALSGDLAAPPFVVEEQGATIWHALLSEPRPEESIVAEIASSYGVEAELIHGDIAQFLGELEQLGLAVSG